MVRNISCFHVFKFFGIFTIALLSRPIVLAQAHDQIVLQKIDRASQRAILKRVAKLSYALEKQDWSAVYDFLTPPAKGGMNRIQFVAEQREFAQGPLSYRAVRFDPDTDPDSFFLMRNDRSSKRVNISGCVEIVEHVVTYRYRGSMDAVRRGTKLWYFAGIPRPNPDSRLSSGPIPCT